MNTEAQRKMPGRLPGSNLYVIIIGGLALIAVVAALSMSSGGLPGTKDSPSATVKGQTVGSKTASD